MSMLETIVLRLIFFSVLGTIDFFVLIGGYGILRGLRMPVNWVIWTIGSLLIAASVLLCLSIVSPNPLGDAPGSGNLLGLVSFLVAVYSASQWTIREWYVGMK